VLEDAAQTIEVLEGAPAPLAAGYGD